MKSYDFNDSVIMGIVLVASPNAIANKPVAAGSSVPEWPAFLASKHHFILLTTAVDDKPSGLSTKSQPSILRPFFYGYSS